MNTEQLKETLIQHYAKQIAYIRNFRIKQDALNSCAYDKRKERTGDKDDGTTATESH